MQALSKIPAKFSTNYPILAADERGTFFGTIRQLVVGGVFASEDGQIDPNNGTVDGFITSDTRSLVRLQNQKAMNKRQDGEREKDEPKYFADIVDKQTEFVEK